MSKDYPLEVLLRPAVELQTSVAAGALAALSWAMPSALLLTPGALTYGATGTFAAMGTYEAYQGLRLLKYQRGMKRLPTYFLTSDQIPVYKKHLFLGKGFKWDQRHTQRLYDARLPANKKYSETTQLYKIARKLERKFESSKVANAIFKNTTRYEAWWNPLAPLPPVGGSSLYHAVGMWEGEEDIYEDIGERVGHKVVLGTTRVGKTRFAEVVIEQDVRRGDITVVFDPKGDADLMLRTYGAAKAQGRKCYIFHLGYPDISARYNAVGSFNRITEVATRISNQLPSEGNSAAFKEFAWRFVNIIARALYALGHKPNYTLIRKYINEISPLLRDYASDYLDRTPRFKDWQAQVNKKYIDPKELSFAEKGKDEYVLKLTRFIKENEIDDPVLEGLVSAWSYDKTYFDKIVSSVGPLMEKLTTGKVADLLSPDYDDMDDKRDILDWRNVIREKAVVYVGLDALSDAVVASAVGNSMFADLTSLAGHLYKNGRYEGLEVNESLPKISVHADEFNELCGDEFVPLLNKAGGAGFQVTVYTQTWSDVTAKVGNEAKSGQLAGNLNTMVMLRVKEIKTAEMLTQQLEKVWVNTITEVSGVNDSSEPDTDVDFTSRNEDRITQTQVPMLEPQDLVQLPKGQAFALIEGGQLRKLRMPMLPEPAQEAHIPNSLQDMAASMRAIYTTGENIWSDRDWYTRAALAAGDAVFTDESWFDRGVA